MNSLKVLFLVFTLCTIPLTEAAVVLKTKGRKVLIHLEGTKTKKGSYFQVLNLYGEPRGLVQVQRVGKKKAIGVLKLGKIRKNWALEPKSKKWGKRQQRIAKLKKRKAYKRRLAAKRKANRRRMQRRLASVDQQEEEYLIDNRQQGYESEEAYQSDSGDRSYRSERVSGYRDDDYYESKREESRNQGFFSNYDNMDLAVGVMGAGGFNNMTLKPIDANLSGFGWEGLGFADVSFENGFAASAYLGYKNFQIENKRALQCGRGHHCFLGLKYIKIGGDLKYIFSRSKNFDLWGGVSGSLLWLIAEPVNNAGIKDDSFGLHGTLGPILGVNIKTNNLIIPLSIQASLFNFPTETTTSWSLFLKLGLGLSL